jgi:enoyl-CoA hydratase/carnithine racemase
MINDASVEQVLTELTSGHIRLGLDVHVATITIDRTEKLNSVTEEMSDDLVRAIQWCNDADQVRSVVLTGAGERAFCAGSDIRGLDAYPTPWAFRNRIDYCDAIIALRKPIVAAVNGYAFGGGLETALNCDIRIASTSATFAASEVKLGWIGGGGVSSWLAHTVGPSNAALMLMTGDPIDAERAERWGIVSELVRPGELVARAQAIAAAISSRPPIAVETAKVNLRAAFNLPHDQAIVYERDLQTICFATEDATEGRRAFAEKREGVFHRR